MASQCLSELTVDYWKQRGDIFDVRYVTLSRTFVGAGLRSSMPRGFQDSDDSATPLRYRLLSLSIA
jgi:hypothetical protein